MKRNKGTTSKSGSSSGVSQSGIVDDASTTLVASGGTSLTHGVMIDSLRRTMPTQLTSWTVRSNLMQFAHGDLAWYDPTSMDVVSAGTPSVAGNLAVNVAAAERFNTGNGGTFNGTANPFSAYSDVPFNPSYLARLKFWALDPDASELDETSLLEPQMFALDEFSQLFAESCSFHFGWLADLDAEYHRLRPGGVVGVFQANDNSPWYNLYHYWRHEIRRAYLDTGLVTLPIGALQGNWRIIDVLEEIERLMAPNGDTLLHDIKLTAKGVAKGQRTAGFGLLSDDRYKDADGNARLYLPWMEIQTPASSQTTETLTSPVGVRSIAAVEDLDIDLVSLNPASTDIQSKHDRRVGLPRKSTVKASANAEVWDHRQDSEYLRSLRNLTTSAFSGAGSTGFVPTRVYNGAFGTAPALGTDFDAMINVGSIGYSSLMSLTSINELPTQSNNFMINDREKGLCINWTGHSLNLVSLIEVARRMGRALEAEVSETLLPAFGQVTSVDALKSRGTGMSAREVPNLYNLYQSRFSFNENPSRTYTAAHLGPSELELPQSGTNALSLEGIVLHTTQGGEQLSARERYWTPSTLGQGAADIEPILGSLLARSEFTFGTMGTLGLTSQPFYAWTGLDRAFIARALGTVRSMYSKVEKQVVLPAGVAAAESTYASGTGRGALELVSELVLGSLGARPKFGLGMAGFSDIQATSTIATLPDVNAAAGASTSVRNVLIPTNRRAVAAAGGANVSSAVASGTLRRDQAEAAAAVPGGRNLIDAYNDAYPDQAGQLDADGSYAVVSPSRTLHNMYTDIGANATYASTPNMLISGSDASMVSTIIKEHNGVPLRSQWGYFEFGNGVLSGLAGAFTIQTVIPPSILPPQYALDYLVNPLGVTVGTGGSALTHTLVSSPALAGSTKGGLFDQAFTPGEQHSMAFTTPMHKSTIVNASHAWQSNAHAMVVGEPSRMDTAGGDPRFVADQMSNIPFAVHHPTNTPMQFIMAQVQELVRSNPDGVAALWTRNAVTGRYELPVSMQLEVLLSRTRVTLASTQVATVDWDFTISVGEDDLVSWPSDLEASGTFTPEIGSPIVRAPEVTDINNAVLIYNGASNFVWDAAAHDNQIDSIPRADNQQALTTYANLTCAMMAGGVQSFQPPFAVGEAMSMQTHHLVSTPSSLVSVAGKWTNVQVSETLYNDPDSVFWPMSGLQHYGSTLNATNTVGALMRRDYLQVNSVTGEPGTGQGPTLMMTILNGYSTLPNTLRDERIKGADGAYAEYGNFSIWGYVTTALDNTTRYNTGVDIPWHQATFVYPDDPQHKMLYRPWRTYVDAAVAKELRLTFLNLGEDESGESGPLGVEVIGQPKDFRFAELVKAGKTVANTFILEKATSKTRMIDPSNRGILTFSRISLLDPTTQRHVIPDVLREYNASLDKMAALHSNVGSTKVYNRQLIRELQLGRQMQRQR